MHTLRSDQKFTNTNITYYIFEVLYVNLHRVRQKSAAYWYNIHCIVLYQAQYYGILMTVLSSNEVELENAFVDFYDVIIITM